MKYILILVLQHYDAGGISTAEFNDLDSCQAAKRWASRQIINRAVKGRNIQSVRAECFPVSEAPNG